MPKTGDLLARISIRSRLRPSGSPIILDCSRSPFAGAVERNLAIDNNRHEPVAFRVFELHNPMPTSRQLTPPAGLLCILFDRLVFVARDCERCRFQVLATRAADRYRFSFHTYGRIRHQLGGDRLQEFFINHRYMPCLILQPQSFGGELHQRRHLSACRDEIVHQFAAADLVLAERDRRHKVLHLEVFDKGVIGIESTRRP